MENGEAIPLEINGGALPILCEVMTAGVRRAKEKNGRAQSCKYRKLRLKIDLEKGGREGEGERRRREIRGRG